ncbi:surface protease GP63 [Trypanosoma cruzi]|nr:surface protease GP63 [Trypanosoma cruzi]
MWHTLCSGVNAEDARTLRTVTADTMGPCVLALVVAFGHAHIHSVGNGRCVRGPVERSAADTVTSTPWAHSNLLDSGGAEETVMIIATPSRLFSSIPRETVKTYLHA